MRFLPEAPHSKEEHTLQLVVFQTAAQNFALPIHGVQEILAYRKPTPLPQEAPYLEGMIELRGKVIPVFDLRKRLRMNEIANDSRTRIVVLRIKKKTIGLIVDSVQRVVTFRPENLQPAPDIETPYAEYVLAVASQEGELYVILDPEKLGIGSEATD
jgi:purine-binding chemotaxis protein CheW